MAVLNGISRDKPGWLRSWQHSTISHRIDFLQRVLADRAVERRFQRRVRLIKWALFLGMAVLLAIFAFVQEKQGAEETAGDTQTRQAVRGADAAWGWSLPDQRGYPLTAQGQEGRRLDHVLGP